VIVRTFAMLMDAGKPEAALVDEKLVQTNLGDNPKHRATAVRAAQESVVMLANGGSTLPLDPTKIKKLLVLGEQQSICLLEPTQCLGVLLRQGFYLHAAGPNADEVRTGDYSAAGWAGGAPNGGGNIDNENMVTPLEGLKLAFPEADVTWSVGTGITGYDG
jgi:beta-glucosidase-like glycosyl hydrolase